MIKKLTIACLKTNLIHIRAFVSESLKEIALRTTDLNLIVLAIDEVCANLIIHSNACDERNQLSIVCEYDKETCDLLVAIKDKGSAFDYENYAEPQLHDIIEHKGKGGIGLLLVRKIMDDVTYTSHGEFNLTRLTKRINPASLKS